MNIKKGKISIVGAGSVGATLAYNLALKNAVTEISLIDKNESKAEAEVLDILHGSTFGSLKNIYAGGYETCSNSEIVVVTAGAKQRPGETRVELLSRNASIMKGITHSVKESGFNGILLVITNPVDVLTYIAYRESGYEREKVVGSGTVLDSSRLREYLSKLCNVNPMNIHGYVLGEHGDTSFPAWSLITIGGIRLQEYCPLCGKGCDLRSIIEEASDYVHRAAYQIIEAKGSTYYAIAQAASVIIEAIVKDQKRLLPVSTVHEDFIGIDKTAFSFPTIVGSGGAEKVMELKLSTEEMKLLMKSAGFISENIKKTGY